MQELQPGGRQGWDDKVTQQVRRAENCPGLAIAILLAGSPVGLRPQPAGQLIDVHPLPGACVRVWVKGRPF